MTIKFGSLVKHDRLQFIPDTPLAFKGKGVEDYFVHAGWAEPTKEEAKHTYEEDEVVVDPENTRHNDSGLSMADMIKHKGNADAAKKAGAKPMTEMVIHDVEGEGEIDNG